MERVTEIRFGRINQWTNLYISIRLLVDCPRMSAEPHAKLILFALSHLPDGLADTARVIDTLGNHFKPIQLHPLLLVLKQVALIQVIRADDEASGRLRFLSTIRHACQGINLPQAEKEKVLNGILSFYFELLSHSEWDDLIPSELLNIRAILLNAFEREVITPSLISASIQYTQWSIATGCVSSEIIDRALEGIESMIPSDIPDPGSQSTHSLTTLKDSYVSPNWLKAKCFQTRAQLYLHLKNYELAEPSVKHAGRIHEQLGDRERVGEDRQLLRQAYIGQKNFRLADRASHWIFDLDMPELQSVMYAPSFVPLNWTTVT